MARVGVASASLRSSRVRGLAKTLVCPAYGKLLGMEPLMHKAVPVLILVFLSTILAATCLQILGARDRAIANASSNLDMTVATLLALGIAYYRQALRARRADTIYNAVRARLETALTHGHSGLWDWDLETGWVYWSDSMFAMLGFELRDDLLLDADIEPL